MPWALAKLNYGDLKPRIDLFFFKNAVGSGHNELWWLTAENRLFATLRMPWALDTMNCGCLEPRIVFL